MATPNDSKNASQEFGAFLDGVKHEQEQKDASSRLIHEVLLAGAAAAVTGVALYATHGRIAEYIAKAADEESVLGRTGLKVADRLGSNTASMKLGSYFTEAGELPKAESYVLKAANRGSADAQFRMSEIVLHQKIGFKMGTANQWDAFHSWTEKAAIGGNPRAQLNFAHHLNELGDEQSALKFLGYSADNNYAPAMREMGKVYEEGVGFVSRNHNMAESMYRSAAAQGDSLASQQLDRFLSGAPLRTEDWTFSFDHSGAGVGSAVPQAEVLDPAHLEGLRT